MKRLLTVLIAALLLSGCVDATATIKKDATLVKIGKQEANKNSGAGAIQKIVESYLFDKVVGTKVDLDKLAAEQLASVKTLMGDRFAAYLTQLQYDDEAMYVDRIIVPQLKAQELALAYLNEKFDDIMTTYTPVKMAVARFAKEADANKANAELLAGGDLAKLAIKYGAKTDVGTVQVYTNKSDLPKEVLSVGIQAAKPFITETPIASTDKTAYFVVQVVEVDRTKFRDEIDLKFRKDATFQDEAVVYYLGTYKFTVHDKLTSDILQQTLPQYLR